MVMLAEWREFFYPNYCSANESAGPEGYYLLEEQPEQPELLKERTDFPGVTTGHSNSHSACGL